MAARARSRPRPLTVAVTGPTGTFGFGLLPLLEADDRIGSVIGIARRPFDPAAHGWSKLTYRQGDVRDLAGLEAAFAGADVVVHLAFMVAGNAAPATIHAINIEGSRNAYRAAASVGAARFVYASSVAAYGFHRDNPVGITESWPTRPAEHFFYAQDKAELERVLRNEAIARPGPDLYLLRPPVVLGPHAVGAKNPLPGALTPLARLVADLVRHRRLRIPVLLPALPVQFVHEDDVGQALLRCAVGAGPPGAYNITADGVLTLVDVAREAGLLPLPLPAGPTRSAARAVAGLPLPSFVPPVSGWAEALSHPAIMDNTKAKEELGWTPAYTSLEALRDTLRPGISPAGA